MCFISDLHTQFYRIKVRDFFLILQFIVNFIYITEKTTSNIRKQSEIPRVEIEDVSRRQQDQISRLPAFYGHFQTIKHFFANKKASEECNGRLGDRSIDMSLNELATGTSKVSIGKSIIQISCE